MNTIEEVKELLFIVLEELEDNLVDEDGLTHSEYYTAVERIRHFEFVLKELEVGGDPLEIAQNIAYNRVRGGI